MSTGIYREEGSVVFGILLDHTSWMAAKAGRAFVRIAEHPQVYRVYGALIMANQAGEYGPISRVGVAGGAVGPGTAVISRIDREEVGVVFQVIFNNSLRVASEANCA